ncbi:MAG: family 4 glycosyl hydrolase [Planctomycetota bacterium]|jgi:alpha-galactosidase
MLKIVFIGAGSQFGATSFVDIMSFEELRECEVVLVDVNPDHLEPVAAYAGKVVEHYGAPTRVTKALDWRSGVLDGADFVVTSFAQGGPAYSGEPYRSEICVPRKYGIRQTVGDTVGFGGVFRTMRTAPELVAIGHDMERRCPGAVLVNYVNPMSMLTRILSLACPGVRTYGLCHNIQGGIREIARYVGRTHRELCFDAAGVNHLDWFLRVEYLDGRDAYPDLKAAGELEENYRRCATKFELLRQFGYWSAEGPGHVAEYVPYFMPREADRESVFVRQGEPRPAPGRTHPRWGPDSDLMHQLDGRKPLALARSCEYGVHIMHAMRTDSVYRMHLNVMNDGLIENLPADSCVEVCCTADGGGVHPHRVGRMPVELAALCRGMADMQTLASDAFLERDLRKAFLACCVDPATAACAAPSTIRRCFNELLEAERDFLEPWWGKALEV